MTARWKNCEKNLIELEKKNQFVKHSKLREAAAHPKAIER